MKLETLLDRIRQAAADGGLSGVEEVLACAVADLAALRSAIPEPVAPTLEPLYASDELTIMNVVWGPRMYFPPHDHRMWASIGIYGGCEDNQLYHCHDSRVHSSSGRSIRCGETFSLDKAAIHSVHNPLNRLTGAIHVYGGAFLTEPRRVWDMESMSQKITNADRSRERFQAEREAYLAAHCSATPAVSSFWPHQRGAP